MIAGAAAESPEGFAFAETRQPLPSVGSLPRSTYLDHNESAYGPSEKVLAAIRGAAPVSNRYARAEYDSLIAQIATLHAVKPEQIVLTCGSSEFLRLAVAEFLSPTKKLVHASPTFPLIGRAARSAGVEVVEIPLMPTWAHNLDAMLAAASKSAGLVYICNPNNPTGSLTPRKSIEDFIRSLPPQTMVLIDEAYHHFVPATNSYASFLDQPLNDPRVMVVRTFSKVYGLAGMRVGYGVVSPDVAKRLNAHGSQLGISIVAVRAAAAALTDTDYVQLSIRRNADDRQEFMNELNVRMLPGLDSHANFVLMQPMRDPNKVIEHLKSNNVFIAPVYPTLPKYVRVSLGVSSDMKEFWRSLDQLAVTEKGHHM
jgi:histidinol-phosphate aminotransferase